MSEHVEPREDDDVVVYVPHPVLPGQEYLPPVRHRTRPHVKEYRLIPADVGRLVRTLMQRAPALPDWVAEVIAMEVLARNAENYILPNTAEGGGSIPNRARDHSRGTLLAADALARWHLSEGRDTNRSWFGLVRVLARRFPPYVLWITQLRARREACEQVDAIEEAALFLAEGAKALSAPRNIEQYKAVIRRQLEMRGVPSDEAAKETKSAAWIVLNHFSSATLERRPGREETGRFVAEDGSLRLGYRQAGKVVRKYFPLLRDPVKAKQREEPTEVSDAADPVPDVVAAADRLERLRRAIDARLAEAANGGPEHAVLTHIVELVCGELTQEEVAARSGHSRSSIQRAYQRELGAIQRLTAA